ncbi:HTTM domain-containing protein [Tamlana sp. 2_MG-2023]|uniref:HTTM domain-containing protein n=1 Tax=unclassified Tamlana TaxID=2614803 RepID=UPI0026E3C96D|nr:MULTISPECIES: HTTM domain-containing protein [unclassified Tamlana]MDO6759964.1 HTTM domain-containing protein [Tamlana sp. 2_MG-2023]MDO6791866.1 HTTM domain-containing protein [Tamlana sp. 1_MG-2023]
MLNKWFFKHIDNSALVVFRIIFGALCFLEAAGAIFTGWIRRTLVEPDFTFNFIGFEWLQPLPGDGMYYYYAVMGFFGLLIMVGYKYRLSMIAFTLMWSGTYLMQKSSYNNHYYLLMLLSALMVILPANRYASIDAKINPEIKSNAMPQWCRIVIILQLFIVYTYAAKAKLYPDWLNTNVMETLMRGKKNYFLVGELLQEKWLQYVLAYGGILFDGLIVPLLLYKPTRKYAFAASIVFHLFNSFIFQIGIFPYLSLAFTLFFFPSEVIQKLFLKKKKHYDAGEIIIPKTRKLFVTVFFVYFIIQIALPLRHHFIPGDVLWTEEGHRLSWRMMLRSKTARTTYWIENKANGKRFKVKLNQYLTKKQIRSASAKPDVIWQFSQRLKERYKANHMDIAVYVNCKVSVNGRPYQTLINPDIDIANVPWDVFKHSTWLLPTK